MFKRLEGDTAVLWSGGVFKQADLYEWQGGLFAAAAGGFVRLAADGSTSKPGVNLKHLTTEAPLFKDRFGRLATQPGEGRAPLTGEGLLQLTKED